MAQQIHEFLLANGFKLLIKEDHRSPIAIFQIFYKVGSSYEYDGITGISHALEHMMFRGTNKYSANKFLKTIAEYGGIKNAFTGRDFTSYYELLRVDKLEQSFALEADRMCNLLLNANDFEKEKQIIIDERRNTVEDNPQRLVLEMFHAVAHLSSPYHHSVIGWMSDIESMSIHEVRNWYQAWYKPNNAIGVVVGDVIPQKVHQLAKKYFGAVKPGNLPVLKSRIEMRPPGMRTVTVKTASRFPWLVIGFNTPVLSSAQPKWEAYALLLLCEILAGGSNARLRNKLIDKQQIAMDINYQYSPFDLLDNTLALLITPAKGQKAKKMLDLILNEISIIQNELPEQKEIDLVKVQIIAHKTYQKDSIAAQSLEIGIFACIGASYREIDKFYQEIANITPQQIQAVARKYLIEDNLTLTSLEPLPLFTKKVVTKVTFNHEAETIR